MESLKSLGLYETTNWDASLNEFIKWNLVTTLDSSCINCEILLVLISKDFSSEFPGNFKIICCNCFNLKDFSDLSLEQQHILTDRYNLLLHVGIDVISESFGKLLRLASSMTGIKSSVKLKQGRLAANIKTLENLDSPFKKKVVPLDSQEGKTTLRKGEEDGAVPPGYRSVAWIRPYEARAIKYSFDAKKNHTVKGDAGEIIFECLYFTDDSFEVHKFKSNVQAIRVNGQNKRVVGWIRREEAKAIIEAEEKRADVEFGHIKAGKGGLIQFFPEHLEIVKKYSSSTRLLRRE
jgi:hypothetical protein